MDDFKRHRIASKAPIRNRAGASQIFLEIRPKKTEPVLSCICVPVLSAISVVTDRPPFHSIHEQLGEPILAVLRRNDDQSRRVAANAKSPGRKALNHFATSTTPDTLMCGD